MERFAGLCLSKNESDAIVKFRIFVVERVEAFRMIIPSILVARIKSVKYKKVTYIKKNQPKQD